MAESLFTTVYRVETHRLRLRAGKTGQKCETDEKPGITKPRLEYGNRTQGKVFGRKWGEREKEKNVRIFVHFCGFRRELSNLACLSCCLQGINWKNK